MSPGKSVLDYELTADGSPILPRKRIEPESSQPSTTTTVTQTNTPRVKGKHLIRRDSYDKILTAIADLDIELTPPPENQDPITTVIEEEKEDRQLSSSSDQANDETKTLSFDEHQTPSLIDEKKKEVEISPVYEQQQQPTTTELAQQQTDLLSHLTNVETTEEQTVQTSPNKKNDKHVRWGEIMINSDDSESSLSESPTEEETSSSEISITTTENEYLVSNKSSTILEQEINSSTFIENVDVDDQMNTITLIESSNLNDQQIISTKPTELPNLVITRRIKSSSSPETSSSTSDSIDQQTTSSDLNESQSSEDEEVISSESSGETQFISTIDPSNQDTFTIDEPSTTISSVVNNESTDSPAEEIESNKAEPFTENEIGLLSLPIIESPINTLIDSISTRYISSDVYHGYLGDHTQFVEVSEIFKFIF
jgi:hypothetical protein